MINITVFIENSRPGSDAEYTQFTLQISGLNYVVEFVGMSVGVGARNKGRNIAKVKEQRVKNPFGIMGLHLGSCPPKHKSGQD